MRLFRFMALLAFLPLVGVSQPIETPSPDRISIAVVPKGTNEEVWRAIHAGAIKARNELKEEGIELEILWKDSSSILRREQEIQVVDTYTGQRLSGILVASLDREKLEEPVRVDAVSNCLLYTSDAADE